MPDRQRKRKNNRNKRKNNKNSNRNAIQESNASINNEQTKDNQRVEGEACDNLMKIDELIPDNLSSITDDPEGNETVINEVCNDNEISYRQGKDFDCNNQLNITDLNNENAFENKSVEKTSELRLKENINTAEHDGILCLTSTASMENLKTIDTTNSELHESHDTYLVESPDRTITKRSKLSNNIKSKSVDDDDNTIIVEVTDEPASNTKNNNDLFAINNKNIIITDADSDIEWQKTNDLTDGTISPNTSDIKVLSVTTLPLNIATCDQANTLSPKEELSLRNFLQSLNLATNAEDSRTVEIKTEIEQIINREIKHRLRNRSLGDDIFLPRTGPSRSLTVIDEEGSGESSIPSRRQSHLIEKVSDSEELEDDVFVSELSDKCVQETCRFIKPSPNSRKFIKGIPQECIRVDARIKDPEITEARTNWSVNTLEKMTGAELVYLTDSSSSTSSIYECNDENDNIEDMDAAVRIITPTIEVTDTEHLLKKSYLDTNYENRLTQKNSCDEKLLSNNMKKITVSDELIDTLKNPHEILVESLDNIPTNLFVKELDTNPNLKLESTSTQSTLNDSITHYSTKGKSPKDIDKYDLEIKVIKCELNDAINNLIKEVTTNSDCTNDLSKDALLRQDSSSSVGSSQCTAKYNPNHSSLNDVTDIICETNNTAILNHVKEVYEHVDNISVCVPLTNKIHPPSLRDLSIKRILSLPYGDKIIEELASVSKRLQNLTTLDQINKLQSSSNLESNDNMEKKSNHKFNILSNEHKSVPPPVRPRSSSFKTTQDEINQEFKSEPMYKCLSPSHKMLMEKTNTFVSSNYECTDKTNTIKENKNSIGMSERYFKHNKPLMSETGSRLLSLLQNSSLKSTSSSSLNKYDVKRNSDQRSQIANKAQVNSLNKSTLDIFRPIPPPKFRNFSSSFYESDDSSDLTENSLRKMQYGKRYFHYSTGNLSKDIENDISSIQNMHRHYINMRDDLSESLPRRPSLPKDLCDQQMEYICQKEKEVDAEIRRLELEKKNDKRIRSPRAPMISEESSYERREYLSHKKPIVKDEYMLRSENRHMASIFSSSEEELLREKMYSEYVNQMAEREKRKQQKIIKISKSSVEAHSKSMTALDILDSKVNNPIEGEFMIKARERWDKLGIKDPETEDENDKECNAYRDPKVLEHKIKVIDSGEEKDVQKLPTHLQEFVKFTVRDKSRKNSPETVMIAPTFKARSTSPAVWRPGSSPALVRSGSPSTCGDPPPPPPPPVWSPSAAPSPQSQRKTFRPVHFEESPPTRRKTNASFVSEQNGCTSGSESEARLKTSHSAPVSGLNSLGASNSSRLPRAQNPTVTLLQKAREGHLSQSSGYIQQEGDPRLPRDRPSPPRGDPVYALRKEYASEGEERRYYEAGPRKMSIAHKKIDGVGPTTKDGMPVTLRSEVKDPSRWYKKMYDTIHKNKYDDDYVTIRYKNCRGETMQRPSSNRSQYAYFDPRSGYLSEPEGRLSRLASSTWSDAYDSDVASGPRRRTASVQEERRHEVESPYPPNKYSTLASGKASQEVYKSQPGRIENYVPGRSSVIDKEAKQWWDEVLDIFDGQNKSNSMTQASPKEKKDITSTILSKSNMARALKESGYESDSTLVFRRREEADGPLSPAERRAAYKDLQAGGEPPLRGFRSPAPPRQESPNRRYVESDVNIHYRCPVRQDPLPLVPERELARQQAEHMKRLYRDQKRNKYLQELQDMQSRRHQDNFMPSQKSVVPLNRYDDADQTVARALYTFNGQTTRELSFRKGDLIKVRRQIDANWYEGEIHGRIGLFPYNYVELHKGDGISKKLTIIEGRARAKFDFTAQTNLELPLKKGEIVVLTRRIDHNWWEGRNNTRTGIFPDSYVTVLQEPSQSKAEAKPILSTDKPVASPAAHGLINGSDKRSMGSHSYTPQPNSPALANAPPATQPLSGHASNKQRQGALTPSERGYGPPTGAAVDLNNTEPLYVDTNAEAIPYRAMYKYRPQNPDELELNEGDTVYVLEKCDDGWYVGSSQRTGRFGTFPGNYVERI